MGKRSEFARVERDFYPTPLDAVKPLLPHLERGSVFYEPCAGNGILIKHLESAGHYCCGSSDIEPQENNIKKLDVFLLREGRGKMFITNPPWTRKILHPLISHLLTIGQSCWLLFDSDWVHTQQSIPFLPQLKKIVSVGRVKWIPNSPSVGKDNCAWHLFSSMISDEILFVGRKK